jgi:hypothetical protein
MEQRQEGRYWVRFVKNAGAEPSIHQLQGTRA